MRGTDSVFNAVTTSSRPLHSLCSHCFCIHAQLLAQSTASLAGSTQPVDYY
jgi:hypothetical protein